MRIEPAPTSAVADVRFAELHTVCWARAELLTCTSKSPRTAVGVAVTVASAALLEVVVGAADVVVNAEIADCSELTLAKKVPSIEILDVTFPILLSSAVSGCCSTDISELTIEATLSVPVPREGVDATAMGIPRQQKQRLKSQAR
jgi:hypothetical protein